MSTERIRRRINCYSLPSSKPRATHSLAEILDPFINSVTLTNFCQGEKQLDYINHDVSYHVTHRQETQHPFKTVVHCSPPGTLSLSWCFARLNNYPGRRLWPVLHTSVWVSALCSPASASPELRHGGDLSLGMVISVVFSSATSNMAHGRRLWPIDFTGSG